MRRRSKRLVGLVIVNYKRPDCLMIWNLTIGRRGWRMESEVWGGVGMTRGAGSPTSGLIRRKHSTVHRTLYTVHSTLYTVHRTLYTVHSTLYILHCTLYTVHCTLYITALYSTLLCCIMLHCTLLYNMALSCTFLVFTEEAHHWADSFSKS